MRNLADSQKRFDETKQKETVKTLPASFVHRAVDHNIVWWGAAAFRRLKFVMTA
jgi:hypothetical protein